jgi:hypothetical protein
MDRLFAQLDSRRRISLGRLATLHATYWAETFPNGTIILTPADPEEE